LGAGQKGEVKAFLEAAFSGDPHALTRMIPNNVRGISQVSFERGCKGLSEMSCKVDSKGTSVIHDLVNKNRQHQGQQRYRVA